MDIEELLGRVADGWERYQRANADRIGAALDTGAALVDLRERLAHGDFLPAVERLGIGETTARNWMRLARAGLKPATVADLGGIRAALEHLRIHAKTGDEIRAIEMDADNAARRKTLGERLAAATPEYLETYAELVRTQGEVADVTHKVNVAITENQNIRDENDFLSRERAALAAENARLQTEIDRRRN